MVRHELDMYVLDALANDLEALDDILRILNSPSELGWRDQHPDLFTADEIVPAIIRGVRSGNIEACVYSASEKGLVGLGEGVLSSDSADETWFRLTQRGRLVLSAWNPPPLRDRPSSDDGSTSP